MRILSKYTLGQISIRRESSATGTYGSIGARKQEIDLILEHGKHPVHTCEGILRRYEESCEEEGSMGVTTTDTGYEIWHVF